MTRAASAACRRLTDRLEAAEARCALLTISLRHADEQVRHLEAELLAAKLALELRVRREQQEGATP